MNKHSRPVPSERPLAISSPVEGASRVIPMSGPTRNRVLDLLPESERSQLEHHLSDVSFSSGEIVHQAGRPITQVYFPTTAVFSNITIMHDGTAVEVTTIGREGLTGALYTFLASEKEKNQTIAQIAGDSKSLPIDKFEQSIAGDTVLGSLAKNYARSCVAMMSQSIACNRLHTLIERCARWLLMTHDRVGAGEFSLTQEFLAMMLGVHRPAVSIAAGTLQQAGFIRYRRGHVVVTDRAGLETAACECYGTASGLLNGGSGDGAVKHAHAPQ